MSIPQIGPRLSAPGLAKGPAEVGPYLTFCLSCQHPCGHRTNSDKVAKMPGEAVQEVVRHRAMITACTIGATVLQLHQNPPGSGQGTRPCRCTSNLCRADVERPAVSDQTMDATDRQSSTDANCM